MATADDRAKLDRVHLELPDSGRVLLDGGTADKTASRRGEVRDPGVAANARLTGSTAAVLLVLLAAEGLTILSVRSLLTPHVFIGMLLVPPVLLKVGSTTYRFARYYTGSPGYRRKGPPPALLRLLGPFVVLLTVALFVSGIVLLLDPGERDTLLLVHKVSFVLWFGVMAIHVLAHVLETAKLAPADYYHRTRGQIRGAGLRQWSIAASLLAGVLLGVLLVGQIRPYLAG